MIYLGNILDVQELYIPRQSLNSEVEPSPIPELSAYTPTSGFSTINGNIITNGGNIEIEARNIEYVSELINDAGYITESALTGYATEQYVTGQIGISMAIETARTESTYNKTTVFNNYTANTKNTLDYLQTQINANQSEISDLWNSAGQLENMIYDVQPVEVNYKSWYWNEDYQNWDYTDERDFTNLDDIYNYIRECQENGYPLYNDNGTYGVSSNFIDGKRYIFTSPVARYESLVDPDRKPAKEKKAPFEGKYVVRKHLPFGLTDINSDNYKRPAPFVPYYFQGVTYFDIYIPNGVTAKIYVIDGYNIDGLKLEEVGYANCVHFESGNNYVPKPCNSWYDYDENVFYIENKFSSKDKLFLKFVLKFSDFSNTVITYDHEPAVNYGGEYLNIYLFDGIGQNNIKQDEILETVSPDFKIDDGRVICIKPSKWNDLTLINGEKSVITKKGDGSYIWKYYRGTDDDNSRNIVIGNFVFKDRRYSELHRRHRSYVYSRDSRENAPEDWINCKKMDNSNMLVYRHKDGEYPDNAILHVLFLNTFTKENVEKVYYHPFDESTSRYTVYTDNYLGLEMVRWWIEYNNGDEIHFTSLPKNRKKLKGWKQLSSQDKYRIRWRDAAEIGTNLNLLYYRKYRGVKSQVPLKLYVKVIQPDSFYKDFVNE
jgi:hypothetical protein